MKLEKITSSQIKQQTAMHLGHSTALQFKMRSSYQEGDLLFHIFKASFVLFFKKGEKRHT